MKVDVKKWFFKWYFRILIQPQFLKITYGKEVSDRGNWEGFYVEHKFLKNIHDRIDLRVAPFWWRGTAIMLMNEGYRNSWRLYGIKN